MPARIMRIDPLNEQAPNGTVIPAVPHVVQAEAQATQSLLRIEGEAVLLEGDTFDCGYRPMAGVKIVRVLCSSQGTGKFNKSGKNLAKVNGKNVISLAGSNTTENDGVQELPNRSTVTPKSMLLTIEGQAVLTGKKM